MKLLLAPAQFKESMPAMAVANCWSEVLTEKGHSCIIQPISDGGEGFVDAFKSEDAEVLRVNTWNPLDEPIEATYVLRDSVAIIEMALASGLELVPQARRDPSRFTTYGTGILIRDAMSRGCKKIIVGMGGSATNDGGMGIFLALGGRIFDGDGNEVRTPAGLSARMTLDTSEFLTDIPEIIGATDVQNVLLGDHGASFVFGPQKQLKEPWRADQQLGWWADLIEKWRGKSYRQIPGSGAAGGLGFGLLGLLNARLVPGFTLVREVVGLDALLDDVDLVLTGEGKLDRQSEYGKAPHRLMQLCLNHKIPVYAIVGKAEGKVQHGFQDIYQLSSMAGSVGEAMKNVNQWMRIAAQSFANDLER